MMVETWKNDAQILESSICDGRILETWVDLRAKQEPCGKTKEKLAGNNIKWYKAHCQVKKCRRSQSISVRSIKHVRNSYPRFVTSSLSFDASLTFQLFPSTWYFRPFVSTLPSSSCTSSFRFKPFMWLRPSIRASSYTILSLTCLFYCNSSLSFVTSFLWFQRSPR